MFKVSLSPRKSLLVGSPFILSIADSVRFTDINIYVDISKVKGPIVHFISQKLKILRLQFLAVGEIFPKSVLRERPWGLGNGSVGKIRATST